MIIMMIHGTMTIHGIMKDTCMKSMIGRVLTSGKENSTTSMITIHTLTIHGSRKLNRALRSHDPRLTNPLLTKLHQRNQSKNQSQREKRSQLEHQHQLLLQHQLQSLNKKQKLQLSNQHHQRSKRRNLKNRQKSQVLPRNLLKRKRL